MGNLPANGTTSEENNFSFPMKREVVLVILYIITIGTGVFGNCVVLRAIKQQKLMKNRILLNLCISDLLVCVVSGPTSVIVALQSVWQLGTIACKATFFIQVINT